MSTNRQLLDAVSPKGDNTIKQGIADALDNNAGKFGLTTQARLTAFIAQASEETNGFRTLKEYASGAAYEGRKDLGNTEKGDGTRFKGRGIFMITGRGNYGSYSKVMYGDNRLVVSPELLEQPEAATISALQYWKDHNLNAIADKPDDWTTVHNGKTYNRFEWITKLINGGQNGESTRELFLTRALAFFKSIPPSATVAALIGIIVISYFLINTKK
jgi:putative chitinase